MVRVTVRYKIQKDKVDENQAYIREVFKQLKETGQDGIRYGAFLAADGQTFVHIAMFDNEDKQKVLTGLDAFQKFAGTLAERRESEQETTPLLTEVGSYNL